ncbi:hypothetical protein PJ985_04040 [Streptomyces sp. ACA25]|uniref:hypothetical protein n=1 Tax=Streptomyces sp. ACA25 TaxID=3022596 RepID=UPI00230822C4|nr:hypothetical protein [Streptomyces sp. ACA25]MDB1086736.1 hypothetical protein [Streptomyces sp. ACA25]
MNRKRVARAGAVTLGTVLTTLLMMLTSPAAGALSRDDPGPGLSVFETLAYFVVAPLALFGLIAVLVVLGDRPRKDTTSNVRPGRSD